MKGLLTLLLLASLVLGCMGCRGYREYVQENNRLGAQAFYHKSQLSYDLDKFNDDIGPKHVYYYE